jgi:hypothetical protein
VLEEGADLYDFQLIRTGPQALRLHVGVRDASKAQPARRALDAFLRTQGLGGVRIELSADPPLRSVAGGKLRRILCASPGTEVAAESMT